MSRQPSSKRTGTGEEQERAERGDLAEAADRSVRVSNETTKRLAPLLRKLRGRFADRAATARAEPDGSQGEPVLCALVRALLEWNAGEGVAANGYAKLCACFVDLNELRVCSHEEFVAALAGHPAAADRAARLRACLADVYRREHAMSLGVLREAPKREARHYLESLDGVPRAVAARVAHEMLDIHAVPVDDRLRDMLEAEGLIEAGTTAEHAAAELERAIASSETREAVALLLAWAETDWRAKDFEPRAKPGKASDKPSDAGKVDASKLSDAVKPGKAAKSGARTSESSSKGEKAGKDGAGKNKEAKVKEAKAANDGSKAKSKGPSRAKAAAKQSKGASNARGRSAKK